MCSRRCARPPPAWAGARPRPWPTPSSPDACNGSAISWTSLRCASASTTGRTVMTIDQDKLNDMLGRFVGDLGATIGAGGVVVGHNLGLYQALAQGPATPAELAARTSTNERYL